MLKSVGMLYYYTRIHLSNYIWRLYLSGHVSFDILNNCSFDRPETWLVCCEVLCISVDRRMVQCRLKYFV